MTGHAQDLTTGNIQKTMMRFVLPYLLSCFLQTFYGLVDLYVVGQFNPAQTSTAVSIGSQVMHMLTVMIVGLAMGTTVEVGRCVGAKDRDGARRSVGTSVIFFAVLAAVLTVVLVLLTGPVTSVMMTPAEAVNETRQYLRICFAGLPFIIAYNVISSVFRGVGDSRSPMIFAAMACGVNVVLDFVFVGGLKMGASGAAFGTILGQAASVVFSLLYVKRAGLGLNLTLKDLRCRRSELAAVVKVGLPICFQDGVIQIAFIVITVIANSRGLVDATSVGVVEKLISFMFLVPSAFLSALSAFTAQNLGAGRPERSRNCLRFSLMVTVGWGLICFLYCQFLPETLIGLFRTEPEIIAAGCAYLRTYSIDCFIAAIHFCFSGYFCGSQRSGISFLHNILSVVLIRVPGAWLASRFFPDTLMPMGLAAPMGSLLSIVICVIFYLKMNKQQDGRSCPAGG